MRFALDNEHYKQITDEKKKPTNQLVVVVVVVVVDVTVLFPLDIVEPVSTGFV